MKPWLKLSLAALLLGSSLAAAEDELAGEKESVSRPVAKPTMAEPEQGGPITLSRSAKGAQAPSFELPEFVITGGGERKAVSRRPDLSVWMDTSGGIKASPSENEASKSQVGSQAGRQTLGNVTESARPAYGQARVLYGLANTLEADAFYGQEYQQLYYLLQASHGSSDGGPAGIPTIAINQGREDLLGAHGGWRASDGSQLGVEVGGHWRDRLLTRSPLPAPRMERSLYQGALTWEGPPSASIRHSLRFSADKAQALLPGLGDVYDEGLLKLEADLEKELLTRSSRTVLQAHLYLGQLDQQQGSRVSLLSGGWLMARMDAWAGGRLSLGISLDSVSGGADGLLVAPRVEFEQRLGQGLGAWVRFAPGMGLSTLSEGLFDKDPALPGINAKPEKDSVNLEAGLSAALPGQVALELKGSLKQNEDALFLADPRSQGLWRSVNVRGSQRNALELSEKAPLGEEFSEEIKLGWQSVQLLDSLGLAATFSPALQAEAWLRWKREPWTAALGGAYVSDREGRLAGGDTLPAYIDLRLSGGYAVNDSFSLIAEARNLLSQRVQEFSGYASPAPFAGAGAEFKF